MQTGDEESGSSHATDSEDAHISDGEVGTILKTSSEGTTTSTFPQLKKVSAEVHAQTTLYMVDYTEGEDDNRAKHAQQRALDRVRKACRDAPPAHFQYVSYSDYFASDVLQKRFGDVEFFPTFFVGCDHGVFVVNERDILDTLKKMCRRT